jgi:hypothetical protein
VAKAANNNEMTIAHSNNIAHTYAVAHPIKLEKIAYLALQESTGTHKKVTLKVTLQKSTNEKKNRARNVH